MSHVREGEIHAYLDGALDRLGEARADAVRRHVAGCEDCRGRLEEERRLRDAADQLLDLGAPASFDMPPFEEIRRRAQAGSVGGAAADDGDVVASDGPTEGGERRARRRLNRVQRLAWAASLVLALGTGWILRGSEAARVADSAANEAFAPATFEEQLAPSAFADQDAPERAPASESVNRDALALANVEAEAVPDEVAEESAVDSVGPTLLAAEADVRGNVPILDSQAVRTEQALDLIEPQRRADLIEVAAPRQVAQGRSSAVLGQVSSTAQLLAGLRGSDLLAPGLELIEVTGDSSEVHVVQRFTEGDTLLLEYLNVPGAAALLELNQTLEVDRRADESAPDAPLGAARAREAEARFDQPAEERSVSEVRIPLGTGVLVVRSHRPQAELEALVRSWGIG